MKSEYEIEKAGIQFEKSSEKLVWDMYCMVRSAGIVGKVVLPLRCHSVLPAIVKYSTANFTVLVALHSVIPKQHL